MANKTIHLLQSARRNGVFISVDNGQLSIKYAKGKSIEPQLLEEIKHNKEVIIDFLNNAKSKTKNHAIYENKIRHLERDASQRLPLSFSQERLWFIDQMEGSVQYHIPSVLRLKGVLNKKALSNTLHDIVSRHEVLRTIFLQQEDRPYQFIMDSKDWQLEMIDGSLYRQNHAGLQNHIQELIRKPFDLSKDYMVRSHLITLSDQEHVLIVNMHHIASDAWSTSIIVKEVVELYASYTEDRASGLMPLEIQYADYAIWQRNYLLGEVLETKINYWKQKLEGVAALQLPTDRQRPAVWSTRGASKGFSLDKALSSQLQALSHQQSTTLFMTLLAAFKVLLHRYSGQQDICVGSPIANRTQQEVEGLIGFFVNTLALRSEVNGEAPFTELLQKVRATTMEAYEHQDVPFEKVVEVAVKERDLSRNPLFQVMLVVQNTSKAPALHLGEVQLSGEAFANNSAKFDITFFITETATGLQGSVEYATDLYNESTISRMLDHFKELLGCIVKDPQQKIGELTMLTKAEEQQLLVEFNDTKADYPKNKTIVDLFEEQVNSTPGNIAVVFEEEQLSYQQLNEKANQLAHYLRSRGVKQETLVPICIERSLEMIVGILGILKAGGAYVPIDPEYPEERISYMLKDTGASIIISSKESRLKLKTADGVEVIEMDGDWFTNWSATGNEKRKTRNEIQETRDGKRETIINPQRASMPHHLAYVLYTSGSTGRPKGVKMEGSALVNLLCWQEKEFENKSRRVVQFASLNFDVSFHEIFSTLCFGGELYLISASTRRDLPKMVQDLSKHRITHLFIPYIVLKNLAEYILSLSQASFSLDEILVAGEQLKLTEDIKAFIKQYNIRLVNQYGPTEAHVVSSYIIAPHSISSPLPPIGKPIDNTQLYILTNRQKLLPVGISGELYIGGVQVARGYLNRPELTAEKFIADSFNKKAGARLYKTGDLARWLADGNIEYLGRMDDQVKIRGYRVELGEIETVLQQHTGVRQGVVLAREDNNGNKRLVGYVAPEGKFNKEEITAYLKEQLLEYMVPALWVELDNLPVTANGKIDRKALPDPDASELLGNNYVAPRNETEEKLAAIWKELLGVEKVGVHDNFFELGGHSLLAIRVISAIRKELEVKLAVNDIFIHPTIGGLVKKLKDQNNELLQPAIHAKYLVPLKTNGYKTPLYIVCGGGGTALRFKEFAEMLDADQPVYGIQPPIDTEVSNRFPDKIEKIASIYIDEILIQNPNGPFALSGHCIGGVVAFEMAKQLEAMGKKVQLLAMFDAFVPENIKREPITVRNLFRKSTLMRKYPRVALQLYLLRRHTKVTFQYKISNLKKFVSRVMGKLFAARQESVGLEVFEQSETLFKTAYAHYSIKPYNKEIIAFFVKAHYYYTDKDNNISFGITSSDDRTNNLWKKYARSVTKYMIEGEHSSIFEPKHCERFVKILQQHLNNSNGN